MPTAEEIIQLVADYYNVEPDDIRNPERTDHHRLSYIRHVATYLLMEEAHYTRPEAENVIGYGVNGARYAYQTIRDRMDVDDQVAREIEYFKNQLFEYA